MSPRPMGLDNVQFPVPMEVVQREFEGALADIAQSEATGYRSSATGEPTIEAVVPAPATPEQRTEDHTSSTVPAPAAVMENQLATPVSSTFIAASAHGLTLLDLNLVVRRTGVEPYVLPFVTPSAPTRAYQPTMITHPAREGASQPRHRTASGSNDAPATSSATVSGPPLLSDSERERSRLSRSTSEKYRDHGYTVRRRSPRPDSHRSRRPKSPTCRMTLSVRKFKEFERFCTSEYPGH